MRRNARVTKNGQRVEKTELGEGHNSDEDQPGRSEKNRQANFFTFHAFHETFQTAQ